MEPYYNPTLLPDMNTSGGFAARIPDIQIGRVIDGRYQIVSLIAQGGMGRVYKAIHRPLNRIVALKLLSGGQSAEHDWELRQRLMLEAAACARLTHPNTIRIFDYSGSDGAGPDGNGEGLCYIAMEFVEGQTLQELLTEQGRLSLKDTLFILRQLSLSLAEAHDIGLIHRDLKPSNIMIASNRDGSLRVKLLDFGLVRDLSTDSNLTHTQAVVGSPSFMSPEQIQGRPLDGRSDIYALGVLGYYMLSGRHPFNERSPVRIMMAHLNAPVPPLEVDADLARAPMMEAVIRNCLQKEPDARMASVHVLLQSFDLVARQMHGDTLAPLSVEHGRISLVGPPISARIAALFSPMAPADMWVRAAILAGIAMIAAGLFVGMKTG